MTTLFILAWRNVWRKRYRSVVTIGAIVLAVVTISLMRSVQYGTDDEVQSFAIRLFTGDLQIRRAGYEAAPSPARGLSNEERNWDALMAEQPWMEAYARRLVGTGALGSVGGSAAALLVGVEPVREPATTRFLSYMIDGQRLAQGDRRAVLLGSALAEALGVGVGDTVVVRAEGAVGQPGAGAFRVLGLLETGDAQLDRTLGVVSLDDARTLLSMPGGFTHLVLKTDDYRRHAAYADDLRRRLGAGYEVLDWAALLPDFRPTPLRDGRSSAALMGLLLVLLGITLLKTTSTNLSERVRDFADLQAVGLTPGRLGHLVLLELVLLLGLALFAGALVSGALVLALYGQTIPLVGGLGVLFEASGLEVEALHFSPRTAVIIEPVVSVAALALLVTGYAVLRARGSAPPGVVRLP